MSAARLRARIREEWEELRGPEARERFLHGLRPLRPWIVAVWVALGLAWGYGALAPGTAFRCALLWGLKTAAAFGALRRLRRGRPWLGAILLDLGANVLLITAGVYWTGGFFSQFFNFYFIYVFSSALYSNVLLGGAAALLSTISFALLNVLLLRGHLLLDSPFLQPPTLASIPPWSRLLFALFFLPLLGVTLGLAARVRSGIRSVEEVRRESARRGAETLDWRSTCLNALAHELGAPMQGILYFTRLLREGRYGAVPPRARPLLKAFERRCDALTQGLQATLRSLREEWREWPWTGGGRDPGWSVSEARLRWIRDWLLRRKGPWWRTLERDLDDPAHRTWARMGLLLSAAGLPFLAPFGIVVSALHGSFLRGGFWAPWAGLKVVVFVASFRALRRGRGLLTPGLANGVLDIVGILTVMHQTATTVGHIQALLFPYLIASTVSLNEIAGAILGSVAVGGYALLSWGELTGRLAFRNVFFPSLAAGGLPRQALAGQILLFGAQVFVTLFFAAQAVALLRGRGHALGEREERNAASAAARADLFGRLGQEVRRDLARLETSVDELRALGVGTRGRQREALGSVQGSILALERLIEDLDAGARLDRGEARVERRPLSTDQVLGEAVRLVEGLARMRGVSVRIRPASAEARWIAADRAKLRHVVANFVANAVKHSPPGGRVEVAARSPAPAPPPGAYRLFDRALEGAGGLAVEVLDRGGGVRPADRPRIFEEFSSVGGLSPPGTRGAGLGLSICRRFTGLMGGDLIVGDRPGGGAHFALYLPRVGAPEGSAGRRVASRPRPG